MQNPFKRITDLEWRCDALLGLINEMEKMQAATFKKLSDENKKLAADLADLRNKTGWPRG